MSVLTQTAACLGPAERAWQRCLDEAVEEVATLQFTGTIVPVLRSAMWPFAVVIQDQLARERLQKRRGKRHQRKHNSAAAMLLEDEPPQAANG